MSRQVKLYGAAAEYLGYEGKEALCESGAGTGKSFCCMVKAAMTAENYPGSRQLFCRQTRKSMNESILPDWRDEVLGKDHESISKTASIPYQDVYRWKNGSVVNISGLENIDDTSNPILSAQYDRIYIFQAEEASVQAWETLMSRMRWGRTPYHQITADVNPASEFHWLNLRFQKETKNKQRFRFKHHDNPKWYDHEKQIWTPQGKEYVQDILGALTGVRRDRLLHHRWVAEEGVIFEEYDPHVHLISAKLGYSKDHGKWILDVPAWKEKIPIAYFTAGVDWGWDPDPGVIQVWAYDSPRWHERIRRFRVAEIYRTRWQKEEWADAAVDLWHKYDVRYFSCDRSNPEAINLFNIRIGSRLGRDAPGIAVKCPVLGGGHRSEINNGIDLMREGLRHPGTGHIRTYFVRDAILNGVDMRLAKKGRPTCTEQEIHSWVYVKQEDGKPNRELPDPKCDEHGIDCWRMDECLNFVTGFGRKPKQPQRFKPGTYGERWAQILEKKWRSLPKARRKLLGKPYEVPSWG